MSRRRIAGFTLIELMIVIAIIGVLAAIVLANYRQARNRSNTTGCESNMKNIGTSLVMYANDNGNRYASALGSLSPNYMKATLTCPSVGFNTYNNGYASSSSPDAFTLTCSGTNHTGTSSGANFPQYLSNGGLKE